MCRTASNGHCGPASAAFALTVAVMVVKVTVGAKATAGVTGEEAVKAQGRELSIANVE